MQWLDPDFIFQTVLPALNRGLVMSIALIVPSATIGFVLGVLTGVARVFGPKWLRSLGNGFTTIFRGVPLVVQLMILYFGLPNLGIYLEPYPASVLGFILCTGAYQSEYVRGALLSIRQGQIKAAYALGFTKLQTILWVVIPQAARRALPGERVFICCDKPVAERGLVFKIGESFSDYSGRIAALPPRRARLDLNVRLTAHEIAIDVSNAPVGNFFRPLNLAPANSRPVSAETLEAEFSASDSDAFELGNFTAAVEGSYFLPASELKAVRREFWEYVKQNLKPEAVFHNSATGLEQFRRFYLSLKPGYVLPELLTETVALKPNGAEPANRKAIRATGVYDFNKLTNEAILPEFCPEGKLGSLVRAIRAAADAGIRRFRVTALYDLARLNGIEADEIIATAPLPGFKRLPGRTSTSQMACWFSPGTGWPGIWGTSAYGCAFEPTSWRSRNTSDCPPVPRFAPSRRAGKTRVSFATSRSPGSR